MSKEVIKDGEDILAIVVRASSSKPGLNFITPNEYGLQVGVHVRPGGEKIEPHVHLELIDSGTIQIQEFLYLQEGSMRVHLYNRDEEYHSFVDIGAGDSILLVRGHSIEFLEDIKLVEVKQGPYFSREKDKRPLKGGSE